MINGRSRGVSRGFRSLTGISGSLKGCLRVPWCFRDVYAGFRSVPFDFSGVPEVSTVFQEN